MLVHAPRILPVIHFSTKRHKSLLLSEQVKLMLQKITMVDVGDTETWSQYREGLCDDCRANCCRLAVQATVDDLIRLGWIEPLEATKSLKGIARELQQAGVIEHYNPSLSRFTLARRANLDCVFLDAQTRRCTVYAARPEICRDFPEVGSKPNYCPYEARSINKDATQTEPSSLPT